MLKALLSPKRCWRGFLAGVVFFRAAERVLPRRVALLSARHRMVADSSPEERWSKE
jgi:hypothetical protein